MATTTPRSIRRIADGFSLLEGPRWHNGILYASDFYTYRVLAFDADGGFETICKVPGQPSGLGWDPLGRLLVVSMTDARLLRLETDGLREVACLWDYFRGPANDMVVDSQGRAYIGSYRLVGDNDSVLEPTPLVRVDPDGTATVEAAKMLGPNGAVITPDRKTMIVAESFAPCLTAFDCQTDGSLSNRREWVRFGPPPSTLDVPQMTAELELIPDGICLDVEGAIWVTDAKGHGVSRVAPGGEIIDYVDIGKLSAYACMLGGDELRTLFICAAPPLGTTNQASSRDAALFSVPVDVPGAGFP
jgi:sugar lactone lactonase YvrE